jgi:hypothetical protein
MRRLNTHLLTGALACALNLHLACSHSQQLSRPEANAPTTVAPKSKDSEIQIGIISYWSLSSSAWDRVPDNSLVLINPADGILMAKSDKPVPDASEWVGLFERLKKKNVVVVGYVPTGYFDHVSCIKKPKPKCQTEARMRRQVETYYRLIPTLPGIFFDETSPEKIKSPNYDKEYELLRSINMPGRITVFNVGSPSSSAVKATKSGEHLVLFESSPEEYDEEAAAKSISELTREARNKGITVWHLIHSVPSAKAMCSYVVKMAERGAQYGYVTNIGGDWENGDQTWNSLPPYWDEELSAFAEPTKPCVTK